MVVHIFCGLLDTTAELWKAPSSSNNLYYFDTL